jgi:hypothetical protein
MQYFLHLNVGITMYTNKLTKTIAIALCSVITLPVAAAPRLIGDVDLRPLKTSYSFFYADPNKVLLTTATVQTQLQERLIAAGLSTTPCLIPGDLNVNNLVCGSGAIRFGADFFSFNSITNIPKPNLPFTVADKDSGLDKVSIEFGVNGRSPAVNQPNETPRVVHIHFNKRIAQFGMVFDPYIVTDTPDPLEGRISDGIQFVVNGQSTPVRDLTQELRGNIPFVGVEDPHGFTDLTIISTGGGSIIGDQFTIVPLTNF